MIFSVFGALRKICQPVILIITLTSTIAVAQNSLPSIWPMTGHDPQRTGRSSFVGPVVAPSGPSWTFTSASPIVGDVAISAEGVIYFSSDKLYALNADGTPNVPALSIVALTGPVVDDVNGFVYVIATNSGGGYDVLRFSKQLQNQSVVYHGNFGFVNPTSPIVGSDGTIYFSDGLSVIAVGSSKMWASPGISHPCFGNPGLLTPTLGRDGSVYSMCQPGGGAGTGSGIYRFDGSTGTQIGFAAYSRGGTELIIDDQNDIRAGFQAFDGITFDGSYDTWDSNLNQLTQISQGNFTTSRSALMLDGSSTVRISFAFNSSDGLQAAGARSWGIVSGPQTLPFFSSVPTIDASGNIFVGTASGVVSLNQSDGSTLWFSSVADTITTQPVISANGTLIVGSSTGKIYAFNSPQSTEWRMQGVNPSRTNVASTKGPEKAPAFAIIASNVSGGLRRIGPDGSLIIVNPLENSTFGRVSDYSKNGILEWQQILNVGGFGLIDAAVATDGTVYVSTVGGVTALDAATGAILWSVNANPGNESSKLAIGKDGTIYFHNGGGTIGFLEALTAVNPDGTVKWQALPGFRGYTTTVFSTDESLVYTLNGKTCCGGLPIGNVSSFSTVDGHKVNDTPCDPRGDVYVFAQWNTLYSGNINNDLLAFTPDIQSCATISAHGMLAVGIASTTTTGRIITANNDGTLGGLDQQGNLLWHSTEPLSQAFSSIDAVVYAIAPVTNDVVALDSEHGSVLWRQHFADPITGQFLADDGNIYLTSGTNLFVSTAAPVLSTIKIVTNNPQATFLISGPGVTYSGSGQSFIQGNAPPGDYSITFGGVLQFLAPASQTGAVSVGGTLTFNASYIPLNLGVLPVPPSNTIGAVGGSIGSVLGISTVNPQISVQEPISTGNGNYYHQHTDVSFPGRGLGVVFSRTYNALDNYNGPLGANWTHSYNILLASTSSGVIVKWGDGHGENFAWTGSAFVPQIGVHSTLAHNGDGTFTLTTKSQVKYLFNILGKLVSITDRNGNAITLAYDQSGNLTQITDTVGRTLNVLYDASNRIIQITDPIARKTLFSYNGTNDLVTVTDPASGVTQYAYDSSHRVTSIILPNGNTLLQNTYDTQGRVTTQKNGRGFGWNYVYGVPGPGQTTITDARGNNSIHMYDLALRIVSVTDAVGGTTTFTYDSQNNPVTIKDANNHLTSFTYDSQGNLLTLTDPAGNTGKFIYDGLNDLLTATTPKGNTTTFAYDTVGNLISMHDPLGNATNLAYDSVGQLASKTDANGHVTTFGYDSLGNLTTITDALGHKKTLAYDAVGRLTSATDANGHTGVVAFDVLNRITKISDPLGNTTQFAYDPVGNLVTFTDANNHSSVYAYDTVNNLISVTDALGHLTQYSYDPNSNRTAFKNAKGNTATFGYEALNRLSSVSDPLGNTTSYVYDSVGNLAQKTDANGTINRFIYDPVNRLTGILYGDGKTVSYTYDADGHRLNMTDPIGVTTYSYDVAGRLTSVNAPGNEIVSYGYDAVGNRIELKYPDAKTLSYGYDATNRLIQVTDWLLRSTDYTYDSANNLIRTAYPNGASISFSYDTANRLANVLNAAVNGKPMLNLTYMLDPAGNRTAVSADGITTRFSYDSLNELISAQLGPLTSTWKYDAVGNRIQQVTPLGTTNYVYDAADRLLQAGPRQFTYDRNGSELSATAGLSGTPILYAYDAANHLVSANAGKMIASSFVYDGDGNRVAQTTQKGAYTYVNDIAAQLPVVLQEFGPDGQITYARGIGLIEEFSNSFNYFYHSDGLGSIIALSNTSGRPAAAYIYDVWGNALLSISDDVGTKNKFRFTGEALDPETQLYYLRARYYDASIGRFGEKDALMNSANRFSYSLNNPVRFIDPTGLSAADTTVADSQNLVTQFSGLSLFARQLARLSGATGKVASILNSLSVLSAITTTYNEFQGNATDPALSLGRASTKILLGSNPYTGIPYGLLELFAPAQTTAAVNGFVDTTLNSVVEGGNIGGVQVPGLGDFTKDVILDFGSNVKQVFKSLF